MRIVQVVQRFFPAIGGVETHVMNLSRKLVERGHDVVVFTADTLNTSSPSELSGECQDILNGIEVRRLGVRFVARMGDGMYPVYPGLLRKLIGTAADVVHIHHLHNFTVFGTFPARISGSKVVLTTHLNPQGRMQLLKYLHDRSLGSAIARLTNAIITFSAREMVHIQRITGKHIGQDLFVLPPGIETSKFANENGEKTLLFRQKYDLDSTRNILYVGRISEEKGLTYLLRAFVNIRKQTSEKLKLVLVGEDAGLQGALKTLAEKKGVAKDLVFAGILRNDDLVAAYHSADIFVFASLFENYGFALIEAMAAGLPIVTTNVGCVPEIFKEGGNGFIVPIRDEISLGKSILRLLRDKNLSQAISRNNKEEAAERFELDKRVTKVEKLYLNLSER